MSLDVVIVGAGLIGCASARALALRGLEVLVVERTRFGAMAASRAAAGMLGAQLADHHDEAMLRLCVQSRELYPEWVETLEKVSGLEVGMRLIGALQVASDPARLAALEARVRAQCALGLEAEMLDGPALAALEPGLAPGLLGAAWFERDGVIDPPALLEAARRAAEDAGATLRFEAPVERIERAGERVVGVRVAGELISSEWVVLAAGSWSAQLPGSGLEEGIIEPVRGQMLELTLPAPPLSHIVEGAEAYLSPRADGRVLVGSTMERVGFEEAVTAGHAARLLAGAIALVPAMAGARLSGHWCGFRPATPDARPILGLGDGGGLMLATGHLRDGVVLAPLTAQIVEALILGEAPPAELALFSPKRLSF